MKKYLSILTAFLISGIANGQWQKSSIGNTSGDTHCFVESSGVLLAGTLGGIFSSTNNGNSWTASNTGIVAGSEILCLGKNSAGIFAGSGSLIYFSNNNGASWTIVNNSGNAVFAFTFLTDTVFAATMGGGVIMSTNNGTSWTTVNTGITTSSVLAIVKKGNLLFAGTNGNGAFVSSNSGANWSSLNTSPSTVRCLETDGTNIYAGTIGSGMYISANNGTSWTQVTNGIPTTNSVFNITRVGTALLTASYDVYRSIDNGATWTTFMNGMNPSCPYGVAGILETSSYVFCGIEVACDTSVYRINKNQVLSINEIIGDNFFFSIYPNPFSYSTTLQTDKFFKNASLTVYNSVGQTVDCIDNLSGQKIIFHRDNLPCGIYFIRLTQDSKIISADKFVISDN
jgi:hypothetical protein